jgi:glucokinase
MTTKKVLVIDIGGTNVKLMISQGEKRKFPSGATLSPKRLVAQIKETTSDWEYDVVALGFPSTVAKGRITKDPKNMAGGWVDYDFRKALGKPICVINDAALQALGSYHGGRMLFLGLGTGLGSTLIWDTNVLPLELGDLPFGDGATIEDHLGKRGLERFGRKAWQATVLDAVTRLKVAFIADYVVLGGGNVKLFKTLPEGVEQGRNRNAYLGGVRMWQTVPGTRRPKWNVIA